MARKVIILAISIGMAIALIGCGASGDASATAVPPQSTQTSPTPTPQLNQTDAPELETSPEPSHLPERTGLTFRSSKWGDDIETVKSYESAQYVTSEGSVLFYNGSVAGLDADIFYFFDPDYGLYSGGYMLTGDHTSGTSYINDYNKLKDAFIEKYGEPASDKIIPTSSLAEYADSEQAIKLGYVIYKTVWDLDEHTITLGMTSDNYEISTLVSYQVKDFTPPTNTDGV